MRKKNYQDLVSSTKEAGRIHRGDIAPTREFVHGAVNIQAIGNRLEGMLLVGLDSGKPIDVTPDYWAGKKKRLAQARRRAESS